MNRTLLYERSATEAVRPGCLTVATSAVHPERGAVRCSAAPLVAADLERLGHSAYPAPLTLTPTPGAGRPGDGAGSAVVFAATYVDVDGTVAGVAVAGPADLGADVLGAAERSVREWAALFRTRRLLIAETAATCSGKEAASGTEEASGTEAAASCAGAARTRETVAEFLRRGDTVVRIGSGEPDRGGPAGPRGGDGPERLVAFDSTREVERQLTRLRAVADPESVSFVVRPCTPVDDVVPAVRALREAFPRLRGQHPDQWCYRSADRRDALRALSAASDVVLLLDRPDPVLLAGLPGPAAVRPVAAVRDIRREWLAGRATVGVVAGPGASAGLLAEVTEALSGLGPYSVVRQEAHRRVVGRGSGHLPQQGGRSAVWR
ncbi:hypothetical protein OG349_15570 [Streptomyces sp. NBC_01317]|uniref:hypothetical protein n=1 Tax=Streptomyces sp. NBC_01317 TaxID=2903822 RepID=UPI002E13249A|nr:hypothetical protein OG349_15570 [Streptomyces sp. NBC_01317]